MFSRKSKSFTKTAAIFDIGNGSIGCSLVELSTGAKPLIVWSYRETMTLHDEVDSEKLLQSMQSHIKSVAAKVATEGAKALSAANLEHPGEALCVFSSPWYISHTKKISIEKDKPFTVSERMLNDLLRQEEAEFQKASKTSSFGKLFADTTVIERKIIETKLNGYQIQDPQGKQASCLEVALFTSIVSQDLLQKVESVIHGAFHFKKITFHSYALAAFSVIRDLFAAEESFLFFDISAELTELSAVNRGILQNTISFPLGVNSLIRSMAARLKTTHEVAGSLLRMQGTNTAEAETAAKVTTALDGFQKEWCGYLHKSFTELSKDAVLPERIFLLVENNYIDFYTKAIEKERCFTLPGNTPDTEDSRLSVISLTETKLKEFVEIKSGEANTSAMLQALFFNKLFNI